MVYQSWSWNTLDTTRCSARSPVHPYTWIRPSGCRGFSLICLAHLALAFAQVVGYIDQTMINMQSDDSGGELDSAGADGVSLVVKKILLLELIASKSERQPSWRISVHEFVQQRV